MRALKDAVVRKTASTIDVFMSSDGQSIPLGQNWVHRIERALEEARLMFVFLSPHSVNSRWIYFEAGHAYARGIRVIPVAILGTELAGVSPPLSLLQGFNANSPDALGNIIAVMNQEFSYSHNELFTAEEYEQIVRGAGTTPVHLGTLTPFIEEIRFRFPLDTDTELQSIESFFSARSWPMQRNNSQISSFGFSLSPANENSELVIDVDPVRISATIPKLRDVVREFCSISDESEIQFTIRFGTEVLFREGLNAQTSRLAGRGVQFGEEKSYLRFGQLQFSVGPWFHTRDSFSPYVQVRAQLRAVEPKALRELFDLLFDAGILYFE